LIVIARQEANLRATPEALKAAPGYQVEPLANLLASQGLVLEPLFGVSEERLKVEAASIAPSADGAPPDLSVYYRVQAPDERLDELAASLRKHPAIAAAYVKPPAELAAMSTSAVEARNDRRSAIHRNSCGKRDAEMVHLQLATTVAC